jgi:hypothetical protein
VAPGLARTLTPRPTAQPLVGIKTLEAADVQEQVEGAEDGCLQLGNVTDDVSCTVGATAPRWFDRCRHEIDPDRLPAPPSQLGVNCPRPQPRSSARPMTRGNLSPPHARRPPYNQEPWWLFPAECVSGVCASMAGRG